MLAVPALTVGVVAEADVVDDAPFVVAGAAVDEARAVAREALAQVVLLMTTSLSSCRKNLGAKKTCLTKPKMLT